MQCKSLFLWSEDVIATSSNEMTPIEVNLTIAVITIIIICQVGQKMVSPCHPFGYPNRLFIYGLKYGLDLLHVIQ